MIVLDTTVLVCAKGADHPLRDPCRDLIAAATDATALVSADLAFSNAQIIRHVFPDLGGIRGLLGG